MNQGFWMAKGTGGLNDGEMAYDNSSRVEPKRTHQWFMDGPEAELFPNKKHAVEVPNNNLFSGILNSSVSSWGNASSFQSIPSHFTDRLFDSEAVRTTNFDERNIQSVSTEKVNMGRKADNNLFGSDPSFGLSMSHSLEDPRSGLNYGGIRKVKVSQVKDAENVMSGPMGHAYNRVDNNTMSTADTYNKVNDSTISMGLAYSKGDDNLIPVGDTYDQGNNIFMSMGQPYNKGDDNISMGQTFKEHNDSISVGHAFSKGSNDIVSVNQTYDKADDNNISMGHIYSKGNDGAISEGNAYNKVDNNGLSIGQSYKGESTIISFGGYDDDDPNPSGRLISSYDLLMAQQSVQGSEGLNAKEVVNSSTDTLAANAHINTSGADNLSKKKEYAKTAKKIPPNNFPSNVRSLLSTGILDGVPVKYIAWSREKELRGVIKGSGYQCGCQSCNFAKVINAYEFERHAGCKTKHPNNHIYFENGKTIYGIVQELRSTPQDMLFDVIQAITGSPINQKSFRIWKESYLAATRELQRIYGKDEGKQLS